MVSYKPSSKQQALDSDLRESLGSCSSLALSSGRCTWVGCGVCSCWAGWGQRQCSNSPVGGQRALREAGIRRAAAGLGGRHRLGHLSVLLPWRSVLHQQVLFRCQHAGCTPPLASPTQFAPQGQCVDLAAVGSDHHHPDKHGAGYRG